MNTNVYRDFQICISAPLIFTHELRLELHHRFASLLHWKRNKHITAKSTKLLKPKISKYKNSIMSLNWTQKFFFEMGIVNLSFLAKITDLKKVLKTHGKTFTMEYFLSKVETMTNFIPGVFLWILRTNRILYTVSVTSRILLNV